MNTSLFIGFALAFSLAALIISAFAFVYRWLVSKRSFQTELLFFASGVLLSLVSILFAVNIVDSGKASITLLSVDNIRELFHSFVQALKVFGVEENFVELYLKPFRALIKEYLPAFPHYYGFVNVYISLICSVAPITTGVFLFDVFTSIFPRLKLFLVSGFKPVFYFNDLNEYSLTFAKSITESEKFSKKPAIVFCDVYSDAGNEKENELRNSAKSINAICLSNDIAHIRMRKSGKNQLNVVLVDKNEHDNNQNLVNLLKSNNASCLKNANIFFFTNSDSYVPIEKSAISSFKEKIGEKGDSCPIKIFPVRAKKNLVYNLLDDVPLYEPLVGIDSEKPYDLTLTIIGCGEIGMEMFLSAYWCSQMNNCRLHINVLSQEDEAEFVDRLNMISPEILETQRENSYILKYSNKKDCVNSKYFDYKYYKVDAARDIQLRALTLDSALKGKKIIDSDYFVVSLGNDEFNISVAQAIKNSVCRKQLDDKGKNIGIKNQVVSYVVFDSEICKTLNGNSKITDKVFLYAFGSREEVYSVDNIILRNANMVLGRDFVSESDNADISSIIEKSISERNKDEYAYWSNNARMLHFKYQLFSNGFIQKSVFNGACRADKKNEIFRAADALIERYGVNSSEGYSEGLKKAAWDELASKMAWCEHRRWNAYIRSEGFVLAKDFKLYFTGEKGSHKNLEYKLHPFLVESCLNDYKNDFYSSKFKQYASDEVAINESYNPQTDLDFLDCASVKINLAYGKNEGEETDYKLYDHIYDSLSKIKK